MREWRVRGERIHARAWELIPWYVNGTLSERERERLEAHLAACRRCAEEERACRRTAEAVKAEGEIAPSPHPIQFQRVLARVAESEQAESARAGWRRLGAPWRLIAAKGGRLRVALAAQAAVILLLLGVVGWQRQSAAPPAPAIYRTLAEPAPAPVSSVRLRVMFSPTATEREVRALLLAIHGEITAGPSPLGVYTVEVPAGGDPIELVLARLRSEPQVAFAERAAGEAASEAGP